MGRPKAVTKLLKYSRHLIALAVSTSVLYTKAPPPCLKRGLRSNARIAAILIAGPYVNVTQLARRSVARCLSGIIKLTDIPYFDAL